MQKIDWTKPLRTTTRGIEAKVVATLYNGDRVVVWRWCDQDFVAHVDMSGKRVAETLYPGFGPSYSGIGGQLVENVPVEPADTICLYRRGAGGGWNINRFGQDGTPWENKQIAPRSVWEAQYPDGLSRGHVTRILVKVPV